MAHMYPEGGPTKDTTSDAERRIYDLLRHTLDDDYSVFHSVPWADKQENGRIENGEIDFIIVHPQHGILLFEVKGGGISYDGATKQWLTHNRHGETKDIKDPLLQASKSMHRLKQHLKRVPATKPYATAYWLSYAAWLPDCEWEPGSIPLPHVQDDLILDSTALLAPDVAIEQLFQRTHPVHVPPMSPEAHAALINVFAPSRTIQPLLKDAIRADEVQLVRLTDTQYRRLDMLLHYPRVAVRGAAGTGKTVLALEAARRYAQQELDVLVICVNPRLAEWVQGTVQAEPDAIRQRISVHHIDALLLLLTNQAQQTLGALRGVDLGRREDLGDERQQARLGSHFARCVNALEASGKLPRYDAIVIDEAQDIERPIWTPLYKLLRDRQNGRFLVFYDPAQRLDDGDWTPIIANGHRELFLTDNCRNTQAIFSVAHQFYTGLDLPICDGPAGRPVECRDPSALAPTVPAGADRDRAALERTLDTLINQQGVAPHHILVVTCRSQKASAIYAGRTLGTHHLTAKLGSRDERAVPVVTVRSAKGLEADVVILTELEGIERNAKRSNLLYVATSRAKHHLIVHSPRDAFLPRQPSLATSLVHPIIA